MSTAPKRCLYEVINLPQTCTQDEIRSAYKKLALQRHPDKLVQSGVSSAEATAAFQELVHAYEVLSDPKERQWYDSHRSQILFSDLAGSNASSPAGIPNLFAYFSPSCYTDYTDPKKGFYKVYSDVFDKIFANEISFARTLGLGLGSVKEAPVMGDLKSPYTQVNAFYGYWLGFATVMDFGWADQWDASNGANRKTRRLMEEDNKKLRKKARREFNETVRGLAEFVKKRDKRVIDMMVMKEKEREKKRKEELEKRKKMEREKLEKAKMFEEPEWARVQEDEVHDLEEDDEEEEERKEWYCVVCSKKFKSDKQWKNHEQSKKHKEKVAELKASFAEDDENFAEVEGDEVEDEEDVQQHDEFESNEVDGEEDVQQNDEIDSNEIDGEEDAKQNDEIAGNVDDGSFESAEDAVSEVEEEFKDGVSIQEEESEGELPSGTEDNNVEEPKRGKSLESDDETSILKAMISGRKSKKLPKVTSTSKVHVDSEDEEEVTMEYNNRKKASRKSRRAKGGKAKKVEDGAVEVNGSDATMPNEENGKQNNVETHSNGEDEEEVIMEYNNRKKGSKKSRRAKGGKAKKVEEGGVEVNSGDANVPIEENGKQNDAETQSGGIGNEADWEDNMKYKGRKKDGVAKTKNSSRSTKQKGKTKQSDPLCEQCGEEFESRNQLHKHLSDTGHASLKSR